MQDLPPRHPIFEHAVTLLLLGALAGALGGIAVGVMTRPHASSSSATTGNASAGSSAK